MYTYSSDWIHRLEKLQHWTYYWHQVDLARSVIREGDRILEIGVGTKFTSNYLKSKGYEVLTIDIDPEKNPDIVGNIVEIDLEGSFDHVLAFEVFEHIPFEDFKKVLGKVSTICTKNLLMSVPRNEKVWFNLSLELPGQKYHNFRMATRRGKIITRNHNWEVDYPPYSKRMLERTFNDYNYSVELCRKVSSLYFYSLIQSD